MNTYSYPALFVREKKGFVVTIPEIPEVVTEGDSVHEAMEFAIDAIETVLCEYMRRQMAIPKPSMRKGKHSRFVELPLLTQAKLSLYSRCWHLGSEKRSSRDGWEFPNPKLSGYSTSGMARDWSRSNRRSER